MPHVSVSQTGFSLKGRVARYTELKAALLDARWAVDHPDGSVDPTLFGASLQLKAMLEFIDGDPDIRGSAGEAQELMLALGEIARGRRVAWLTPKHDAHTPRLSQPRAHRHGCYAGIMDALMDGGMNELVAADFVVKNGKLLRSIRPRGRRAPARRVVQNWRDRALGPPDASRADEQEGFRYAKDRMATLRDVPGADAEPAATFLLTVLRKEMTEI